MWYVIQTKTGEEEELKQWLDARNDPQVFSRCFVPLFEDVRRSEGRSRISIRRFFPGYLFIDTEAPEEIVEFLRKIPKFSRVLAMDGDEGEGKIFIPVEEGDREFFDSLFDEGVMRVSYVKQIKGKRIGQVVGPLARYQNRITKMDVRHRMAIVEAEMFGKLRRIKFGLWTDEDAKIPWIEEEIASGNAVEPILDGVDIGISVGDKVVSEDDIYESVVYTVTTVDPKHRTIGSFIQMGDATVPIQLFADRVRKVE